MATAVGVALLVGGLLSFVYGAWVLKYPLTVHGLGPLDGLWSGADYCFLGALQAAVGAGLATLGRLGLTPRPRA